MLKMTKQPFGLLSDVDMLLMIDKARRGGILQVCSKRYAKANNKYLPDFSPDKPTSYLMYFDAHNLYGWAMSESQPDGNFKWVKEYEYISILDDIISTNQEDLKKHDFLLKNVFITG